MNHRFNEPIQKLQLTSTLSGSAPIQQGIAHYLQNDSYDNHLRKLRKIMQQRQSLFIELIQRYLPQNLTYNVPEGGYFIWVKLPNETDSKSIYQALLQQQITVAYGKLFSSDTKFKNYLRLNTSMPVDGALENAIKKIGELLTTV